MFDALAGPLTDIDIEVVGEQHAWSRRRRCSSSTTRAL